MKTQNTTNQTTTTKKTTLTKEEKQQRSKIFAAKRLEAAKQRYENLTSLCNDKKGLANSTLFDVHAKRANTASIDGLINDVLSLIKEVAKAANVDKQIIGCLKKEAANVINANVNNENLCLYIDGKGLYKNEIVYRLICSRSHNEELKKILNNLKKEANKKEGAK